VGGGTGLKSNVKMRALEKSRGTQRGEEGTESNRETVNSQRPSIHCSAPPHARGKGQAKGRKGEKKGFGDSKGSL